MQQLLDAYYNERRKNETLQGNIKLLQAELQRVKENYDFIVNMSQIYKDITEEEKQAELTEARKAIDAAIAKVNHKIVVPKYVTGGGSVPAWGIDTSVSAVDTSQKTPAGNITLVDYEYDTGHVIPGRRGDDTHHWG